MGHYGAGRSYDLATSVDRLVADAAAELRSLWASIGVDESVVRAQWGTWLNLQSDLIRRIQRYSSGKLGFDRLIPDVLIA